MNAPWSTTLATVAEHLNGNRIDWMLLGSAATALRGVPIIPGDIDIALLTANDVTRAATVLPTPDPPDAPELDESGVPPDWISTTAEPARHFAHAGEQWTFGRWFIDGVKVELAHIDIDTTRLNLPLLRRAISDKQSEVPTMTVPEPLQRLLRTLSPPTTEPDLLGDLARKHRSM